MIDKDCHSFVTRRNFLKALDGCLYRSLSLDMIKGVGIRSHYFSDCGKHMKDEDLRRIDESYSCPTDKTGSFHSKASKKVSKSLNFLNFPHGHIEGFNSFRCFYSLNKYFKATSLRGSSKNQENSNFIEKKGKNSGRFKRRKERCSHLNEKICEDFVYGRIERYNLKARFGKIVFGNQKLWVYEDDLVLSGVNLRKFKESVKKKYRIVTKFLIKQVNEGEKMIFRPASIQVQYENLGIN